MLDVSRRYLLVAESKAAPFKGAKPFGKKKRAREDEEPDEDDNGPAGDDEVDDGEADPFATSEGEPVEPGEDDDAEPDEDPDEESLDGDGDQADSEDAADEAADEADQEPDDGLNAETVETHEWAGDVYEDQANPPSEPADSHAHFSGQEGEEAWLDRADDGTLTGWVRDADGTVYRYSDADAWAVDVDDAGMDRGDDGIGPQEEQSDEAAVQAPGVLPGLEGKAHAVRCLPGQTPWR